MIKPVAPENWIVERLTTAIDGKFDQRTGFTLSDISFSIFYHHLFRLSGDKVHLARRDRCLNSIFECLEQQENAALSLSEQPFYFNCLANIIEEIQADTAGNDAVARFNKWNRRLAEEDGFNVELGKMCYLTGWAGIMNYFLSLPATFEPRQQLLKKYAEQIKGQLQPMCDNDLFFLPDDPEHTDMGLAKGICGVLTVMIELAQIIDNKPITGFIKDSIRRLIRLRQEVDQSDDKCSFFPYRIDNNNKVAFYDNRLCWSNSDLGHALLLCRAGALCENRNYLRMAEMIALNTLLRKNETHTGINDASLANGAAGVARMYKSLFEFTGNEDLMKGYYFWISKTIGFVDRDLDLGLFDNKEADLLEGLSGVGLTLLSHKHEHITAWSKVLLI
jgi:hypothetical protein